ncbi:MAG TPA: methylamine utilization protein [Lacunisphaera sp.]|nr:methylamine utilization protein [Lacunisphaera sp.]
MRVRSNAIVIAGLLGLAAHAADSVKVIVRTTLDGKPVADAVVSATPLDHAAPAVTSGEVAQIEQKDQEFRPYVTAIQVGATVNFPNHDTVQHHIYSLSKPKRFEIPLYQAGASQSVVFDTPGVVTIGCNIHDWMVAYIVVLPTPFFAKTDATGAAALPPLPSGRYRLEVWHPRAPAPLVQEITSAPDQAAVLEFSVALKPDKRIRRAPSGKSIDY